MARCAPWLREVILSRLADMAQWPASPRDPSAVEGGHIRPLTAAEYLGEVERVNCEICPARPGERCIDSTPSGETFCVIWLTPDDFVIYHEARKKRAERKVGL
jgi:hypothetical protein